MTAPASGAAKAAPGPLIAGVVLLGVGIYLFVHALSAGDLTLGGPGLAPVIVTGLWVAVAACYVVSAVRERIVAAEDKPRWLTPFLLLGGLIAYSLILKFTVVGYVLATVVFFVGSARLLSVRPWREVIVRDVSVAIGLSLAIYFVFTRLLGIALPAGVLPL